MTYKTMAEFQQKYNDKLQELAATAGTPPHDRLDQIAQSAYELLGKNVAYDKELSLTEKKELVRQLDVKYSNLGKKQSDTSFEQLFEQTVKACEATVEQDKKDEEPQNIYLSLFMLVVQIVALAAALLLLGLFITNPIIALAIVKVVTTFALNIWSTSILPFLIQNALNISIMLPFAAIIVAIIKIIDYRAANKAIAEEQQEKEAEAQKYYKGDTSPAPKAEPEASSDSAKLEDLKQRKTALENQYANLASTGKKLEAEQEQLRKQIAEIDFTPIFVIDYMKNLEKKLFDLEKLPSPTPYEQARKLEIQEKLIEVGAEFEKRATKRATNALEQFEDNLSEVGGITKAHKAFLSSVKKLALEKKEPQKAKEKKKAAPADDSWAQKLMPWQPTPAEGFKQSLVLSNLATACKVLDGTTEEKKSILTKSVKVVCQLLKDGHTAHELYSAGFSMRDINAATPHAPANPENDAFLAASHKMPAQITNLTEEDKYSREIAALKSKLQALTANPKVTEEHDPEVLRLDAKEKDLLNKAKDTSSSEKTRERSEKTRERNEAAAYRITEQKAELLKFKAKKAKAQPKERRQALAEIKALQGKLEAKIAELLPKAKKQEDSKKCYQFFDQEAFMAANHNGTNIDLVTDPKIKALKEYLVALPTLDDENMVAFLMKMKTLDEQTKSRIISALNDAYSKTLDLLKTGKKNYPTEEEFDDAAKKLIHNGEYSLSTMEALVATFEDIDLVSRLHKTRNNDDTKKFTILMIQNEAITLMDPLTGRKISPLDGIDPLHSDHRYEREDLTKSSTFLGMQLVEHLAYALLKDIPTMLINEIQFSNPNAEEQPCFMHMLSTNHANKFSTSQGAGTQYMAINPRQDASVVAVILALPGHYISITFQRTAENSWTAYVVDSFGKSIDYKNIVDKIIDKFKTDLGVGVKVDTVYSTDNHQQAAECGIHAIENIRAVAEAVKVKSKTRDDSYLYMEDKKQRPSLAYLDLASQNQLPLLAQPLSQQKLDKVLKNNAAARQAKAIENKKTRREILCEEAFKLAPYLEGLFNFVKSAGATTIVAAKSSTDENSAASTDTKPPEEKLTLVNPGETHHKELKGQSVSEENDDEDAYQSAEEESEDEGAKEGISNVKTLAQKTAQYAINEAKAKLHKPTPDEFAAVEQAAAKNAQEAASGTITKSGDESAHSDDENESVEVNAKEQEKQAELTLTQSNEDDQEQNDASSEVASSNGKEKAGSMNNDKAPGDVQGSDFIMAPLQAPSEAQMALRKDAAKSAEIMRFREAALKTVTDLLSAEVFKDVSNLGSQKEKGVEKSDPEISDADKETFREYIAFAAKQKLTLESKLARLEKLEDAVLIQSKAANKAEVLTKIKGDKDSTKQYIAELSEQIDVISALLPENLSLNQNLIIGITRTSEVMNRYKTETPVLAPVAAVVELSNYQPKKALVLDIAEEGPESPKPAAEPAKEAKAKNTETTKPEKGFWGRIKQLFSFNTEKGEQKPKTKIVVLNEPAQEALATLFYALAAEKRDFAVKAQFDPETVLDFELAASPAYNDCKVSLEKVSPYHGQKSSLSASDLSSVPKEEIDKFCAKHKADGSRAEFFAKKEDVLDRFQPSFEDARELLRNTLPKA